MATDAAALLVQREREREEKREGVQQEMRQNQYLPARVQAVEPLQPLAAEPAATQTDSRSVPQRRRRAQLAALAKQLSTHLDAPGGDGSAAAAAEAVAAAVDAATGQGVPGCGGVRRGSAECGGARRGARGRLLYLPAQCGSSSACGSS